MHRQKRQHVVTQWPPAYYAPYKGPPQQVRNINSNSLTNSIHSPDIKFDNTTSEGQALQMDNKLEEYVDRQAATIMEKYVQALQDRILQLENHVQTMQERISSLDNQVAQLEAANKEKAIHSAVIPLSGGIATNAPRG